MKKKFAMGLLLSIFLASFAMVGSAGATPISTLADLVGPPPVSDTIGDKVFSGWMVVINYNHTYSASFTPGDVGFTALLNNPPANQGPGFQLALPMSVYAGGFQDLLITYTVTVLPGQALINDASLAGNVSVTGPTASATVTENIYTDYTESVLLAQLKIYATGTSLVTYDHATFAPQCSIFVTKDINVQGDGMNGNQAGISQLVDRYSEVPVPPSALLFAPGLLGLFGIRKRFKA